MSYNKALSSGKGAGVADLYEQTQMIKQARGSEHLEGLLYHDRQIHDAWHTD